MGHLQKLTMDDLYRLLEIEVGAYEDAMFDEAFFSWSKQDIARNKKRMELAKRRRANIQAEIDRRQNR